MAYNLSSHVIIIGLALTSSLAHAKQNKIVFDGGEVTLNISVDQLTRIKVEFDRISSVKLNQGELELLEDKKIGDIYLKPSVAKMAPISAFISTEKGRTYKLLLKPKSIPSEQIILSDQEDSKNSFDKFKNRFKDKIIKFVRHLRSIKTTTFEEKDRKTIIAKEIEYTRLYQIYKLGFVGEIFEYTNKTQDPITLDLSDLEKNDEEKWLAWSIDIKNLAPQESSKIYVVKGGKDGNY
jgi:conjugal transfer pilus assembly protein TraK